MPISSFRFVLLAMILSILGAGCARSPGGIAASNIPLSPGDYTPLGLVSGSDCKINLLGLIPVSGGNRLRDAERKALGKIGGADALVDITVDRVAKYFILWSQLCTEVHATAVSLR